MPALAPPVTDERDALRAFLSYRQEAFFAVAHGLTDDQARGTPTASALSIGGLIKHATGCAARLDAPGGRRPERARSRRPSVRRRHHPGEH